MKMGIQNKQTGFTIVELLIVIVVIGILAAIVIVAYNGVQDRAKDSRIRSVGRQIDLAFKTWQAEVGGLPVGGWGSTTGYVSGSGNCTDGTGGWVRAGYACNYGDYLIERGYLKADTITAAPSNSYYATTSNGTYSFMFYPCSTTGTYALYYSLRRPSSDDSASIAAAEAAGCPTGPRLNYGMRAAKLMYFN